MAVADSLKVLDPKPPIREADIAPADEMIKPADNVVAFEERRSAQQAARELFPVLSEDALALQFVNRHLDCVRFDCTARRWFIWDGSRWRQDKKETAFSWTRELVRLASIDEKLADRQRLGTLKFVRGVEGFAQRDQRIVVGREHQNANENERPKLVKGEAC